MAALKTHAAVIQKHPFYVTGHSLGGAMATLAMYDLMCQKDLTETLGVRPGWRPDGLVTFGGPPAFYNVKPYMAVVPRNKRMRIVTRSDAPEPNTKDTSQRGKEIRDLFAILPPFQWAGMNHPDDDDELDVLCREYTGSLLTRIKCHKMGDTGYSGAFIKMGKALGGKRFCVSCPPPSSLSLSLVVV
jgi:hypothetical protein